ncbi:MAG: hypothetical protein JXR59_03855 [Desulfuromonadaceae bacterium]|nr:hypothetical protein [Desulfuromonadaceae bacterium]
MGLTLDEATDQDTQKTINDINVLLDPQVARFAGDQVIHYVQDGFTITPKSGSSCSSSCSGCGSH